MSSLSREICSNAAPRSPWPWTSTALHVMLSGDSSWRSDLFRPLFDLGLDVVIPCINGGFGNMGHIDAARMTGESGARIAIPSHFWTFAEQGAGDPLGFINARRLFAPSVRALLLRPGEGLSVEKGGAPVPPRTADL